MILYKYTISTESAVPKYFLFTVNDLKIVQDNYTITFST